MNIAVFGANGRVGSKVVRKLLDDGHKVFAFVHGTSPFASHPKLIIVQGDIHDYALVAKTVSSCDAVVSALGSWGTKTKDIQVAGMINIIPAMKAAHIKRIVSLTGAGAYDSTNKPRFIDKINHLLISKGASKVFKDGEQHIAMLRASGLDWTVVRSPIMKASSKHKKSLLTTTPPLPWETIVRAEVATTMAELVTGNDWLQQSPFIRHA